MIEPFVEAQRRDGCISYGLSSYGYDARVAPEFKIFTNVENASYGLTLCAETTAIAKIANEGWIGELAEVAIIGGRPEGRPPDGPVPLAP